MNTLRTKLEQNLGVAVLLLLLLGCLLVLWPFASALLWASVLSFSLWPLYERLLRFLKGRHTLAATVLSLAMILLGLMPFVVVVATLGDNVTELKAAIRHWIDAGPPAPPGWLEKIPLVGSKVAEQWENLAADTESLVRKAAGLLEPLGSWLLKFGFKIGVGLIELALSILLTFFFLRNGPKLAGELTRIIGRIAGGRGLHLLTLAGSTVRGVVYGILGTALVQAVTAGIGLFIAGVPGAALLAMLTFFLSVVPMGPPLILLPAAFWLFHQGSSGWGIFMLIWAVFVSTIDNFVKPWLISQGSSMPFVLILFGVIGGALVFGFIGVFIGPTLLAVGYRLVTEWSAGANVETAEHSEARVPGAGGGADAPSAR